MPTTRFFACASTVLVDKHTNSVSMIEIIDKLEVPAYPHLIPQLSLLWIKSRDADESTKGDFLLRILVNGKRQATYPVFVDYQNRDIHRSIVVITGVVIEEEGVLELRIVKEKKKVASTLIPLSTSKPPAAPPPVSIPKKRG